MILRDKTAAVTGAASGIGRELALQLADEGCTIAISDIDADGLAETARIVSTRGVAVDCAQLDVANRAEVHAWADRLASEFGPVYLVINNAGVSVTATAESISYDDLERVMNVNFWGVVHGTKAFLPHLRRAGEGCIVNLSSGLGLVGIPRLAGYVASKFAIRGFTEALQQELELEDCGITAICVHPGFVKTGIVHTARMADPEILGMDREQMVASFNRLARTTAGQAARAIIQGVKKGRRRILIGADARFGDLLQRLTPAGCRRFVVRKARPGPGTRG